MARALKLLLLLVLLIETTLPLGVDAAEVASDDQSSDGRLGPLVYNGESVDNPGWVASILDGGSYTCAGSLVEPSWVLTAAHCVDQIDSSHSVNVGGDRWFEGHSRSIVQVRIHPGYDPEDLTSIDLAMVLLDDPVPTPELPVLASSPAWPVLGQDLVVLGWGLTSDAFEIPDELQGASVLTHSDSAGQVTGSGCFEDAVAASGFDDFCFGGDSWACSGDSGGALVGFDSPSHSIGPVRTIYGLTSFGDAFGCESATLDSVAQSVGRHFDWIRGFFTVQPGPGDEMFFYRQDGLYRFYDARNDGSLSKPIRAGNDYTTAWSTITGIDLDGDGQDEMFFYRDDGLFRFYNVKPDASLPTPMLAGNGYTTGWDAITAVDLDGDGQDEIFFYRDDGLFRYYDINANGQIGSPILAGSGYTKDWDAITAVDLDGDRQDEMFFYRNDGLFRYYDVRPTGDVGLPILAGSGYTTGWAAITALDLEGDGQDEMFFYRTDGLFRYYDIRSDATLSSPILAGSGYTKNWDSITALQIGG